MRKILYSRAGHRWHYGACALHLGNSCYKHPFRISIAKMVAWNRLNVMLYLHCLSCSYKFVQCNISSVPETKRGTGTFFCTCNRTVHVRIIPPPTYTHIPFVYQWCYNLGIWQRHWIKHYPLSPIQPHIIHKTIPIKGFRPEFNNVCGDKQPCVVPVQECVTQNEIWRTKLLAWGSVPQPHCYRLVGCTERTAGE